MANKITKLNELDFSPGIRASDINENFETWQDVKNEFETWKDVYLFVPSWK